ncbi:hypothetical protein EON81_19915 [bacterium]|nr:MAG: hypothetical protein EON81_19915 [bacterium]
MSLRQNLINRMGAMGFGRIVAGLNGTQSDDPEVLARIITDDVTAQAQELHQNNPILATLRARGITDHAGLDGLLAQANAGNEYVNDLRSEAKKEAIRALGAEDATPLLTSIATMGLADARAWRDHYRSKADAQFGTGGGTRPVRQTAAANASAADVDQPPAKKRLWERLPAEDRATAAKSCDLSTEAKQDAFAESLFAKTPQVFEEAI